MENTSNHNNSYDWIHLGKTLRFYRYPSRIPSDEIIETFKDNLKDIIQPKLKEALKRRKELKVVRDRKLKVVRAKTERDSIDEYFWSLLIFHEFSEAYVIEKWIDYWLNLWYKVSPQSLPQRFIKNSNTFDEWTIQQARNVPIEKFYEGRLRRSGARLSGLCPFHEERTPSFFIFSDNHFHCYGCQAHGDVIDFVMKTKGISFTEAVRYLL